MLWKCCLLEKYGSVQFSHSVMSDSLWPHGLQHSRPRCPSASLRVYPNVCPLSRWCHSTISSPVGPFYSRLQSFLFSPFFLLYFSLQYCIGFAIHQHESAMGMHVFPILNPLPPPSPYHLSGSSQCTSPKPPVSCIEPRLAIHFLYDIIHVSMPFSQIFFIVPLSHPYMTTGKTIALTRRTFVDKVMSLLFNILSRLVINFLPRSKHLLN